MSVAHSPAQMETLRRFCRLSGLLAESHDWDISADCICDTRIMRHSHEAVSVIEDIVLAYIGKTREDLRDFANGS